MKKKFLLLCTALIAVLAVSCTKSDVNEPTITNQEILIGISTVGVNYEPLPTRSSLSDDLLAIQIYELSGEELTPYAAGLFSDWTSLVFKGYSGSTYRVEATMVVDGSTKIYKSDESYGKPFNCAVSDDFIYDSEPITEVSSSTATLADGIDYITPTIDRYYGVSQKRVTNLDATISTTMKRMSFGVKASGITDVVSLSLAGAPEVELQSEEMVLYTLNNFSEAYSADESIKPYSQNIDVTITNNGTTIYSEAVEFQRNKLATIAIEGSDVTIGFDFEDPFEGNGTQESVVINHNLHYCEIQQGISPTFWVTLKDGVDPSTVEWYYNNFSSGTYGESFTLNSPSKGIYNIECRIGNESVEATVKVYTSPGVYILNEPNMTGSESIRGINKHIWGETTVSRFVTGSYEQFGITNQYIQNWNGRLYVVAPYSQSGVSFSSFNAQDGTFIKAHKTLNGDGRTFSGIDEQRGVISTTTGVYIVNLEDFSVASEPLMESSASNSTLVSDGYLFVISNNFVNVYDIDELSPETTPTTLGAATAGFVKSKDGAIWAANGTTLLRIDPMTLTTTTHTIPDGVSIKFSSAPWKQVSWTASSSENAFYFTKDSWGTGSAIYKYDIDNQTLVTFIEKSDFDNYMLYGTSLYFDAERGELIAQGMKGYGDNSDYNGIWGYNGSTGDKNFTVLYETTDRDIYPYKDMFFPAMMTPIKNF